ncbi:MULTISPECIES: DUF4870 domain-containing protein [Shewanella]|jgi:uncharacterized Tic20 family protein|uniref:DUF4870 domain-containing protein n=3 Tax=Shewanella putrefaciens TaxID=24 RepID=E6XRN9_SHEP2|nr:MULTISPECIES: DUF4870 domain-containing protein [Shewanella]CAD6367460.1 hypothetical protein SHEWT2_02772 [Shewanella hafniensis]ABM23091.1 conserved hypothetical protein [Shewanella sp. W3-18-1]AVV84235.1 hypothetical protein SPWS13_2475 [Shewanella putrefaciens]MCA1898413.1 DUF4870 domain-containing protein [Shewanella putrefaciens]MCK7630691.1 DUF4870 domain-containing protein [Shewanella sp. JNE9-1]
MIESVTKSDKDFGLLVYASSFIGYLVPLGSILGPLIIWLMKREESAFVDQCGRSCLNFKLSLLIYVIISGVLAFIGIGFIFLIVLAILDLVCTVLGIIKASEGQVYRYPLTIKFISMD